MGQKDLTQKNLDCYPDVFADIVNALLYDGRKVLVSEKLSDAPTETVYCDKDNMLRNQLQDVSKYEVAGERINVQYTLENENRGNAKTVLRKAGYEGAIYRGQYHNKVKDIYPVVSVLLNWGKRRWKAVDSIHMLCKKRRISDSVIKYVDDIRLHVFDMRYLTREVRARFTSDMRIVVDYLAEKETYHPGEQPIKHAEALLRLLKELSGDVRYEKMIEQLDEFQEGEITMCGLLDKYEERGIEKGIEKGEGDFATLMERLFQDNRMEDARLVLKDGAARKRLYRDYGIC